MSQEFGSASNPVEEGSGMSKTVIILLIVLIGLPLLLILCACVVIGVLTLLGPVIGNVFSNIVTAM